MRIGFDARLINETGVGRYIKNILPQMIKQNKKNHWVVTVCPSQEKTLKKILNKYLDRVLIVTVNARWHSLKEQFLIPFIFYKHRVDILHVPYINVPIFYFKKMAVTIHDLTVLKLNTGKSSTTLHPFLYKLKRLGYIIALKKALRSTIVFTVCNSVKKEILLEFPKINPSNILVVYNGFTKLNVSNNKKIKKTIRGKKPYFFYVGNAHPHKNLEFLVSVLDVFFKRFPQYNLVLAGRKDFFYKRLLKKIRTLETKGNFIFVNSPTDSDLGFLYKNANLVILPSLKEGFGLQILEAIQFNKPILCSDIPVYKEVSNNTAYYFNPKSRRSFILNLGKALKNTKRGMLKKYKVVLKKYNWEDSAMDILHYYTLFTKKEVGKYRKPLISRIFSKNE